MDEAIGDTTGFSAHYGHAHALFRRNRCREKIKLLLSNGAGLEVATKVVFTLPVVQNICLHN